MKPRLILYCQHSLGMGHLVRSLALADALTKTFDVVFLNGGRWPDAFARPQDVSVIDLPPIGMAEDGSILSLDETLSVDQAKQRRTAMIAEIVRRRPPAAVLIELYPFGRKKFRFEIDPLIRASHGAVIACSVRDMLVHARHDQQRHDDRAAATLNDQFHCVIVHSDETFARLEETFKPSFPLRTPVVYSGFVVPERKTPPPLRCERILVSAGGGVVGGPLFRAAIEAYPEIRRATGLVMTVVAGPFLPEDEWRMLKAAAERMNGVTIMRATPDLFSMMAASTLSVSQCGYNAALDILRSGATALVVPFVRERETEQMTRARRLEALGAVSVLHPDDAGAGALAANIIALHAAAHDDIRPRLKMDGARETAAILNSLVDIHGAQTRAGSAL